MPIKKSELYSSLWKSCDELRGGMDASQYKDYVLVLLFVKYVSDRHAGRRDSLLTVPKGGSFADMVALRGNKDIGDGMNKIIARLAEANDLKGVIDVADFNEPDKLGSGKEMVDRLSNLVAIFDSPALDFRGNRADGDDLMGDAYEYLMRHFATESGKSKGQFYTPAEVSRIMAKVIGAGSATSGAQTIYDPTCGSGSLLLKAHDEAKARSGYDLTLYGQERDNATAALARMNMILHDCATAEIHQANTLTSPFFKQPNGRLKTFDFVVANPPFSDKAWSSGINPANDQYGRFPYGIPPAKNGDYAFLLHVLASLKSTGKAAIILPHGVLFRGNAEATIRREILRRGYIKGIIGLPANLFYGTGIPACILVLDKEHAATRQGIFFIDASKGFAKDGPKNRLREQDIHKIVDVFTRQTAVDRYARTVPLAEIEANDFNLNIPRYIDSSDPEDLQDIEAHLRGGIPIRDIDALAPYWEVLPGVREALFQPNRPGYMDLKVPQAEIKATIASHPDFARFQKSIEKRFEKWRAFAEPLLRGIDSSTHPKQMIETLSEKLLELFRGAPLLDPYDVYQHLMAYWAETMQDDVYMIVADGWVGAAKPRLIISNGSGASKEKPDFTVGRQKFKAELIPPALLIARYFAAEQAEIEALEAEAARIEQQLEVLREEHGGEEGLLANAVEDADSGKITRKSLKQRLEEIEDDPESLEEGGLLLEYLEFLDQEGDVGRRLKVAQKGLEEKLATKYGELPEAHIRDLVVDDKWITHVDTAVQTELDGVTSRLSQRLGELTERYECPLPKISQSVADLQLRVEKTIQSFGIQWN